MNCAFGAAFVSLLTTLLIVPLAKQSATLLSAQISQSSAPGILVELFTSEGCSSCPPADELLRQLDAQRSASKSQIVVLSEHVDYWDGTGWRDRFSSREYTDRQEEYARRLGIPGPYTPEMVVDGKQEFVGNSLHLLRDALEKAAARPKASVLIPAADIDGNELKLKLVVSALPPGHKRANVYVAIADNADQTPVKGGENSGRELRHVAVLRSLQKVAKAGEEGLQKDFTLHLPKDLNKDNLRVVAFVQESGNAAVLGSAVRILGEKIATR